MKINLTSCKAVLFDMDGVITKTTSLHARAWKNTFDCVLERLDGKDFEPFDLVRDYKHCVDGKPRHQGVISFLEARGIDLRLGEVEDLPGFESIWSIANLKNDQFHKELQKSSVHLYDSTIALINLLKSKNIKVAVVTASENGVEILNNANILNLFDTKVDGVDARRLGLKGKPDPGVYLEAAKRLGVDASQSIVVEDAIAGVQAGRAGGFYLTIGVARDNNEQLLLANGADIVVKDLCEVGLEQN